MGYYISQLTLISDAIFNIMVQLIEVIKNNPILLTPIALWILRKVVKIFNLIKG